MSETLRLIMKHWTAELPKEEGFINLPFNIEEFCRENDLLTAELSAMKEVATRWQNDGRKTIREAI
jgi:hypothetical protein